MDMRGEPVAYKSLMSMIIYLKGKDKSLHIIIERQCISCKNDSEQFWDRILTPVLKGFYYKVYVDYAQSIY